jgi:hypothetical protein
MKSMRFNPNNYGLRRDYLYEVLACTFRIKATSSDIVPNTSCMGIRLIENDYIKLGPYPNTTTCQYLKENGLMSINLIGNIYYYTLAALKGKYLPIKFREFPEDYYDFKNVKLENSLKTNSGDFIQRVMKIPSIKDAWGVLYCEVIEETQRLKGGAFGDKVEITEFKLRVINSQKLDESYKLFNRAENLMLETIILATRLKVAIEKKNNNANGEILSKINENLQNIKRFGKNHEVLESIPLVEHYINKLQN